MYCHDLKVMGSNPDRIEFGGVWYSCLSQLARGVLIFSPLLRHNSRGI